MGSLEKMYCEKKVSSNDLKLLCNTYLRHENHRLVVG